MDQQLQQFTFYDIYHDVIAQLSDEEAGRFGKRICNFAVFGNGDIASKSETENCFWEIILPTLTDATETEKKGKTPYHLNRQMKHFTFKAAYARMLNTMKNDATAGKFVKVLCGYMFNGTEPDKLEAPIDSYFRLFKKSFDISKCRSESGKKGGKSKKKPMTCEEFLKLNPHIHDDIYSPSLKDNRDWQLLNDKLKLSESFKDKESLYIILKHYDEIIAEMAS